MLCFFNNRKEVVQCLIVLRFGLQLQGIGSLPLTKLVSTDVIDLWSLLGPDLTMEGSLLTEGPFFFYGRSSFRGHKFEPCRLHCDIHRLITSPS